MGGSSIKLEHVDYSQGGKASYTPTSNSLHSNCVVNTSINSLATVPACLPALNSSCTASTSKMPVACNASGERVCCRSSDCSMSSSDCVGIICCACTWCSITRSAGK